jgi:hypothetical protein
MRSLRRRHWTRATTRMWTHAATRGRAARPHPRRRRLWTRIWTRVCRVLWTRSGRRSATWRWTRVARRVETPARLWPTRGTSGEQLAGLLLGTTPGAGGGTTRGTEGGATPRDGTGVAGLVNRLLQESLTRGTPTLANGNNLPSDTCPSESLDTSLPTPDKPSTTTVTNAPTDAASQGLSDAIRTREDDDQRRRQMGVIVALLDMFCDRVGQIATGGRSGRVRAALATLLVIATALLAPLAGRHPWMTIVLSAAVPLGTLWLGTAKSRPSAPVPSAEPTPPSPPTKVPPPAPHAPLRRTTRAALAIGSIAAIAAIVSLVHSSHPPPTSPLARPSAPPIDSSSARPIDPPPAPPLDPPSAPSEFQRFSVSVFPNLPASAPPLDSPIVPVEFQHVSVSQFACLKLRRLRAGSRVIGPTSGTVGRGEALHPPSGQRHTEPRRFHRRRPRRTIPPLRPGEVTSAQELTADRR